MAQTVLVFNAGSSSLKFTLLDVDSSKVLVEGIAERLGTVEAVLHVRLPTEKLSAELADATHNGALQAILDALSSYDKPSVIGHRVVHGGTQFSESVLITPAVIRAIESCSTLAPLHNPANLEGINAAITNYPNVPQVAVFDTAFHATIPDYAYLYALPRQLEHDFNIRKYGFHGTSHRYISGEVAKLSNVSPNEQHIVIAHLGNGGSVTAVAQGKSVDTSMGMTPTDGLVMGTRSGSLDPGILIHLMTTYGYDAEQLDSLINKQSGLLGLSALSSDMRELEEAEGAGSDAATLAIEVFCYRLAQNIAAMAIALPRLDALVFTAGIGENSPLIRERTVKWLVLLGIVIDAELNHGAARKAATKISPESAAVAVWVIPTNEELMIANEAIELITAAGEQ
ncbi:MAG: acetate kinase [Pseudomonadales bacterium]|jgi:acetate kinase